MDGRNAVKKQVKRQLSMGGHGLKRRVLEGDGMVKLGRGGFDRGRKRGAKRERDLNEHLRS